MRCASIWVLLAVLLLVGGCGRKKLSDIPINPKLTMDEYEDQVGTPSEIGQSTHWIGYALKGGGELRLYFFNGPRGGRRLLSQAVLFTDSGKYVKAIWEMPNPATTEPSTEPSTAPTTRESGTAT